MFQLTLVDHIRLSFGSAVSAYEGHTEAAFRLTRWTWRVKIGMVALLGLAAAAGIGSVMRGGIYTPAAAVLSAIAFAASGIFAAIDPAARVHVHRAAAASFWLVCEKYRALLSEIHDGLLEVPGIIQRRDALLKEVSELFAQAPPADRATFEIARKTLGTVYSDQQVDQFLPQSLRRPAA